jgi:hypothetical protein
MASRRWQRVETILEAGQEALGDTVEHLSSIDRDDRDRDYVHALAECMQAASNLAKEQREAVQWLAKNRPSVEEAHGFVTEYLDAVGDAQAREIVARLSARLAPS